MPPPSLPIIFRTRATSSFDLLTPEDDRFVPLPFGPLVPIRIIIGSFRFYRATRMHSADYAVARCLSVCLSVNHTPVLCLNGYTYPKVFSPSGIPTILVFPRQTQWQYSDGNPPNGGVECKGYDKMTIFSQISRSISETVIVSWAHAARQFVSIEFSFHPYNI